LHNQTTGKSAQRKCRQQ